MFHRFIRLIFLAVLFLSSGIGAIAQCPDTHPIITGPDVVGASATPVKYFSPLVTGHYYTWKVTELQGGLPVGIPVVTTNFTGELDQVWFTPGDYQIELSEGITGNGCAAVAVTPPLAVLVKPMLAAYFYYEFDAAHGCYYNEVNFTATGDGKYPPEDPSINYEWKYRVYSPQGPWLTTNITPVGPNSVKINFPATPGVTYEVNHKVTKLIATRTWEDEITDFVYVDPDKYKPVVVLDIPATPNCLNQPFSFSAVGSLPTLMPTSETFLYVDWDFGDGTTQHYPLIPGTIPQLTTTHTYTSPATRTVTVTLVNTINCTVSKSITIDVPNTIPVAAFSFAQTCVNEPAPFTDNSLPSIGTITDWWWNWDDGTPSTHYSTIPPGIPPPATVTHVFTDLVQHNVTLKVLNSNGCDNTTIAVPILAQPSPKADFTYPIVTCTGDAVQFNSSLSSPLTGTPIASYLWDFNDPTSPNPTSIDANPTHLFTGPGSYLVSLTVTNQAGCANTKALTATNALVISPHPFIEFSMIQGVTMYQQIFTAQIDPAQNVNNNVLWEFGDGTNGFGSPITHTYPGPGAYTAKCTAIDMLTGCSSIITHDLVLGSPPAACFTANPPIQCQDAIVQFIPCPPGGLISTEDWDFGDGSAILHLVPPAVPGNPTHTYAAPGPYTVTRVLNLGTPLEVTFSVLVNIFEAPTATFTWFSDPLHMHQGEACSGETVYFTDGSYSNSTPPGTIYQWAWDFDDPLSAPNNTSTVMNPSHTFTMLANGGKAVYNVTLRVKENLQDCESPVKTLPVTINPPIPIGYTIPTVACAGQIVTFQSTGMDPLTIANWTWDFGDGLPVSHDPISTTHAYLASATGIHTTTLTVTDIHGCTNSLSKDINVVPSPTAGFTYSSPTCEGDLVSFTDQSVPGGPAGDHITSWVWTWGDGTTPDPETILFGGNPNVQHRFPVVLGTYSWPVHLTVTNTYGCVNEIVINVNLLPAPVASFTTLLGTNQCAGQPVQFQSLSDPNGGGPIIEWSWNFGDNPPNNTAFTENPTHTYALDGTYRVTLVVKTSNNCVSTIFEKDVTVNKLPDALFSFTTVCEGDPTVFTDLSVVNAPGTMTYLWDFGGGITSPSPSPSYIFPVAGLHPVTLTVTNSNGCSHSLTQQVMVNPKAVALFHFTTASCENSSITFYSDAYIPTTLGSTASITSWSWDFGDLTTGSGPLVVHLYNDNQTSHQVTLTITTSDGCISALQQIITHFAKPTANFSHTGYECEQQTISFFDNSTTVGGIAISSRLWNFGDPGSIANNTSTQLNPTHDFTTFGPFDVTLTVTDVNGCVSVPKVIQIIIQPKPVAAFTASSSCLSSGTVFADLSTPAGGIQTWFWQYDDGLTDFGPNPTHFFFTSGTHAVTLTVTTPAGCTHSITQQVEVFAKPTVTFSSTAPVCAGNVVTFTDYSQTLHGYIATRIWNFGDGPDDPPTPSPTTTHTYATGGSYDVTLKVITSDGCTETRTVPIQIQYSPFADFLYSTTLCQDMSVQFTDHSAQNGGSQITSWSWDFGDLASGTSNFSFAQNPGHTFTTAGPYTVTLIVSNVDNCTTTTTKNITIGSAPTALFTVSQVCQGQPTVFDASASNTQGVSDIASYSWDFGDTQTGIGQIANHPYSNFGYYDVTLTIINNSGCTSSVTQRVFVEPNPISLFHFSQVNCIGSDVSYYNDSFMPAGFPGTIVEWKWEYGDTQQDIFTPATVPTVVTHTFADNLPVHTVKLTVTSAAGCFSWVTHDVNSVPSPVAHITVDPTNCVNQTIQFSSGTSSPNGGSPIQSYAWNFGDGGTANVANPVHTYVTTGPKIVTLFVTNASGCISASADTKTVTINAKPRADFTFDPQCQGGEMTFVNTSVPNAGVITTSVWDFGDMTILTNPTPPVTHTYATSGTFQVTLTVTTDLGCFKDTTRAVEVYGKPFAAFTTTGATCAGDSVQFNAMSSSAFHGYIVTYRWNFDDLTPVQTRSTPTIWHTFANGGTYNVRLEITTSDSCKSEKINPVVVKEKPMADFTYPAVRCAKMQMQFTDISQGGGGAAVSGWSWNFGDPGSGAQNISALPNPVHEFSVGNANDTVRLIVTNINGCKDTTFKVLNINDAPFALFSADTACMSSPTQFTDLSTIGTGSILAWQWDFGDPGSGIYNTSTLKNPTHKFDNQGTYFVNLQVTTSNQCVHDTTMQVIVNPKPTAMFQYTPACVGDSTQFTDLSLAPGSQIRSWLWNFGCPTCTSTDKNPKWAFPTAGNYNVKLVVTTFLGCSDSVTMVVIARKIPFADFTSSAYYCPAGKVDFQDISTATASSIADRLWTFLPGANSNIPNPSYVFPATNMTYPVTLSVTDTYGCKDDTIMNVFVKPGFTFSFTSTNECEGFATAFDTINVTPGDQLYNVSWNFGDPGSMPNNTSLLLKPTHVFSHPGTFVVKMKAYNTDNCVDSVYHDVTVYQAPKPLFGYVGKLCSDTINFSDSTLITGSGTIQSWSWDFGDVGSPTNTSILQNPYHVYGAPGIYTVKLIMESSFGCKDSITRSVQRFPCIMAGFTFNDTLCARYKVSFTDNSIPIAPPPLIQQWHWTWGDGTDTIYTVHNSPIMHTYADSGSYNVNLEIQTTVNGIPVTDDMVSKVIVRPTPNTFFSNPPTCLNQISLFRDTSKTYGLGIARWHWDFGAAVKDTSNLKNPVFTYDTAGIYNVKLVVMNKYGCKDSLTKATRIYGLPAAHYDNTAACEGDPTFFTDKSVKSDTTLWKWRWSFGDLTSFRDTSVLMNPSYRYPKTGLYDIRMIVKDHYGCIDTVDSTVKVNVTPISSFTVENNYNGKQGQVKMNNLTSGDSLSYFWNFGNGKYSNEQSPVALFTDDDTYTIQLITMNQFNCTDTTFYTYELLFKGLYVPNAFSPSSTNLGVRLFKPIGVNLKQYHVTVFDIWGHLMWESTKLDDKGMPAEGWDGTFEGVLMPQGNYMWKISALFVDDSQWEGSDIGVGTSSKTMGSVTLIR
ncbi:MAG: PKD domain-containing protein [Bacteroidetes bacterium]|nr:PKD domain-containing protein [Bacteroidota bacterium]